MFKVIHTTPSEERDAPGSLQIHWPNGKLAAMIVVNTWGMSILSPYFHPSRKIARETRVDFNEYLALLQIDLRTERQIKTNTNLGLPARKKGPKKP